MGGTSLWYNGDVHKPQDSKCRNLLCEQVQSADTSEQQGKIVARGVERTKVSWYDYCSKVQCIVLSIFYCFPARLWHGDQCSRCNSKKTHFVEHHNFLVVAWTSCHCHCSPKSLHDMTFTGGLLQSRAVTHRMSVSNTETENKREKEARTPEFHQVPHPRAFELSKQSQYNTKNP